MELTGEPDGPPTKSGLSMVDYSGGFVAAISLLAGVHAASRDGVGMDCDVSLYDTAMAMLTYPATWHLNAGFTPVRTRHSAHPSLVPFQAFEATDGWMVVGCAKEKFWARLAQVIGHPEWARGGLAVRHVLPAPRAPGGAATAELEAIFATRTVDDWLSQFYAAPIPCGPINDVEAALKDEHPSPATCSSPPTTRGTARSRQLASPVRVGADAPDLPRARPSATSTPHRILTEMRRLRRGRRIAELSAAGAFGGT